MSQNDNIASSGHMSFAHATEFGQPMLFPLLLQKTVAVDMLLIIYFKNNLRIDYKKRLICFCGHFGYYLEFVCVVVIALSCGFLNIIHQTNGGILDIKIIFMEQKEHLLCNLESRD